MSLRFGGGPAQTASSLVKGTTTNDNAPAGFVGEYVTAAVAIGGAVGLSTGVTANITSISLTAGDWDVSAVADISPAGTTNVTAMTAGVSTTSATLQGQAGGGGIGTDPQVTINQPAEVPAGLICLSLPPVRVSLAATTTIFFVANCTFTVAALAVYGTVRARRIR